MMESGSDPLGDSLDDTLTCPICFQAFTEPETNPKTLPHCFHSFCLKCLENYVDKQFAGKTSFLCPTCRREAQIPEDGVKAFTKGFFLERLYALQMKKRTDSPKDEPPKNISKPTTASSVDAKKCKVHPDEDLLFFCEKEKCLICRDCIVHEHSKHIFVPVSIAAQSYRDDLKKLSAKIQVDISQLQKQRDELDKSVVVVRQNKMYVVEQIKSDTHRVIEEIKDAAQYLIKQVEEKCRIPDMLKEKEAVERSLHRANNIKALAEDLLQYSGDAQIIATHEEVLQHAQTIEIGTSKKFKSARLKYQPHSPLDYSNLLGTISEQIEVDLQFDSESALGAAAPALTRMALDSPDTSSCHPTDLLKHPVKFHLKNTFRTKLDNEESINMTRLAFACTRDNKYVILYYTTTSFARNTSSNIKVFSKAGEKLSMFWLRDLKNPCDVAISNSQKMIISDTDKKYLSVFNIEGQLVNKITLSGEAVKNQKPCLLAVNSQADIVVGCRKDNSDVVEVHVFNEKGKHLRHTASVKGSILYVAINKNNNDIILPCDTKSSVKSFRPNGILHYEYCTQLYSQELCQDRLVYPSGVTTDIYGHVFIADRNGNNVHMLDKDGNFMMVAISELSHPVCVIIDEDGDLVVLQEDGTIKIYSYEI